MSVVGTYTNQDGISAQVEITIEPNGLITIPKEYRDTIKNSDGTIKGNILLTDGTVWEIESLPNWPVLGDIKATRKKV